MYWTCVDSITKTESIKWDSSLSDIFFLNEMTSHKQLISQSTLTITQSTNPCKQNTDFMQDYAFIVFGERRSHNRYTNQTQRTIKSK